VELNVNEIVDRLDRDRAPARIRGDNRMRSNQSLGNVKMYVDTVLAESLQIHS
jgi:hypothetical protein